MSYTRNQNPTNEQRKLQLVWDNIPSGPLREVLISENVRIKRAVSKPIRKHMASSYITQLFFYQATHTITLGQYHFLLKHMFSKQN